MCGSNFFMRESMCFWPKFEICDKYMRDDYQQGGVIQAGVFRNGEWNEFLWKFGNSGLLEGLSTLQDSLEGNPEGMELGRDATTPSCHSSERRGKEKEGRRGG